jgi:hypothetical protein
MTRRLFVTAGADGKLVVTHARPYDELDRGDRAQGRAAVVAQAYRKRWGHNQVLEWFQGQNFFWYLFDSTPDGATDETRPANRVVAGWGSSNPARRVGDRRVLRGFPLPRGLGRRLDRGHLVALASGGGENVNLVPQATRLNRGWSEAGRRWRALERICAKSEGVFLFVTVLYDDLSDTPSAFEFLVQTPDGVEVVEQFINRD